MISRDWAKFFAIHKDRAPRQFLLDVLAAWPPGGGRQAIDLGCGTGSETVAMLHAGWNVLAVDAEAAVIDVLLHRVSDSDRPRLHTVNAPFDAVPFPPADLVHAGFSLPFCAPDRFDLVWESIQAAVLPGGRFAGQLFGVRDSWKDSPDMTFFHREEVSALLTGWEVEVFEEVDQDGVAVSGPKHWHLWHICARRPAQSE